MNEKTIIISLVLMFALTGCFKNDSVKQSVDTNSSNKVSKTSNISDKEERNQTSKQSKDSRGEAVKQTSNQAVEKLGLVDLFKQGKGMKCLIGSEDGTIITYSNGDKARTEGVNIGFSQESKREMAYMINDGEWIYTWSGKKGTKINMKKLEELEENMDNENLIEDKNNIGDFDEMVEEWEDGEVTYDCNEQKIDDELFVPPSDVDFQNMMEMISESMKVEDNSTKVNNDSLTNQEFKEKINNKNLSIEEAERLFKEYMGE